MAGGDSYGASLSSSQSSAASLSGGISADAAGNYGLAYGPGTLVNPVNTNASGVNVSTPIVIGVIVAVLVVIFLFFRR